MDLTLIQKYFIHLLVFQMIKKEFYLSLALLPILYSNWRCWFQWPTSTKRFYDNFCQKLDVNSLHVYNSLQVNVTISIIAVWWVFYFETYIYEMHLMSQYLRCCCFFKMNKITLPLIFKEHVYASARCLWGFNDVHIRVTAINGREPTWSLRWLGRTIQSA